jgi:tetratricopeptide (TPR) repeat protein
MGFRFFKRINILPGVTLNLSKSGPSLSVGPRGARVTIGRTGTRATLGVPGTGMHYTTKIGGGRKPKRGQGRRSRPAAQATTEAPQADYFDNLKASGEEKSLVEGCRELAAGNLPGALEHLQSASGLADGAFLAGFAALQQGQPEEAARFLEAALQRQADLGRSLSKFGLEPAIELPITEEVAARIQPAAEGVLLALAETLEHLGRRPEALAHLRRLHQLDPADVVVRLSLAELILDSPPLTSEAYQEVARLGEGIENDTPVHTALLLYQARALRGLGLAQAAEAVLAQAARRKKGRPADLLCAVHYERALAFQDAGEAERARAELEKVYAMSPGYEDVAARLGL